MVRSHLGHHHGYRLQDCIDIAAGSEVSPHHMFRGSAFVADNAGWTGEVTLVVPPAALVILSTITCQVRKDAAHAVALCVHTYVQWASKIHSTPTLLSKNMTDN